MNNRRDFLRKAAALLGSAAAAGITKTTCASSRTYYVWYKQTAKSRWRGSGPYNWYDAHTVVGILRRRGVYSVYIGGRNG